MTKIQEFLVSVLLVVSAMQMGTRVEAGLQYGFYENTCPQAEGLVHDAVKNAVQSDARTGAGLIRILFHDCFVEGCDASVLVDSTSSNSAEKDAIPNQTLHGFEVIDSAKSAIEATCPGVVSCADILAIAARDSVSLLGGLWYDVETGRRDGTFSSNSNVGSNIPSPLDDLQTLTNTFGAKGLSQSQMVTLSGAHTIGKAHCGAFTNRLYNFSSSADTDPSLDASYAETLKAECPQNFDSSTVVDLDPITDTTFDNQYYKNLLSNKGLMSSDEILYTSSSTQSQVVSNANDLHGWQSQFSEAIQALVSIGVKTGSDGEIRLHCRVINSS